MRCTPKIIDALTSVLTGNTLILTIRVRVLVPKDIIRMKMRESARSAITRAACALVRQAINALRANLSRS